MNKNYKSRRKTSKHYSFVLSAIFILIFIILLVLSLWFTICSNPSKIEPIEGAKMVDWFSTQVSNSYDMNIPFSIFIQLITTIGGVFFGIKIDQWLEELEEKEKLGDSWQRIYEFLCQLKKGIENDENIYELYEYKIYWDSIQRADETATKLLQQDPRYREISTAFSFLSYYINSWKEYPNVKMWEINANTQEKERIVCWKNSINDLIEYVLVQFK